jgi:hypothetical protein
MNKLSKLIKRLLVIARAPDTKYLIGLNLQAIQKVKGKPQPGEDPRTFYQALQTEATKGPIFTEATLKFMDKLDLELTKDEVKWIATRYQKKARIDVATLGNVLDYLRAEKPDLSKLSYQKAVQNSIAWHEQFKGKEETSGLYKTKNVILKLTNGYTWVEVPAEDLETEGDNMGHCVGGDDYVTKVKAGKVKIFSLRDSSNKPHVTIEIDSNGKVIQVQGKENKEPVEKYHAAIEQLWNHLKIEHNESTAKYITDPKLLTEMAGSKKYRTYVARNPNLPVELMKGLAEDKNDDVRYYLTGNPNLPVELMQVLAKDKDPDVRGKLAHNPKLPLEIMRILVKDKNVGVRYYLTGNPNLPVELMQVLAKDKDDYVRRNLARNPNLPVEILNILAKDKDAAVRRNLARNPNLPVEILNILAKDKDAAVRSNISYQPNLPVELLNILVKDKDADVRSKAKINLRNRNQ